MVTMWSSGPITAGLAMDAAGVPLASHVVASEGTQHVFYASQDDGHIHEYWWRPGQVGATHGDLMSASGAPPGAGPLTSHVVDDDEGDQHQSTQHVFYQSSDGHLRELWWSAAQAPSGGDLTEESSAPPARAVTDAIRSGAVASHVFAAEGTQHLYFASVDGDIHELWWRGSQAARHENLSMRARRRGPTPAATGCLTSHVDAAGLQHVLFVAAGAIIDLAWGQGEDPLPRTLTAEATGAPPATSPLTSHAMADGTQHVFYVSADRHVHELWWSRGQAARHEDVTVESKGPLASSIIARMSSHVLPADGSQHLYYPADFTDIVHTSWIGGGAKRPERILSPIHAPDTKSASICGHVFSAENTQHVFYWGSPLDSDRLVLTELWSKT
jgi:hypothetical protein